MEVDWDLHAVVRACCSTATITTATTAAASSTSCAGEVFSWPENFIGVFQDPFRTRNDNSIEQFLNVLNNPLQFSEVQKQPQCSQSLPVSPLSVLGGLPDQPLNNRHHIQQHQQQKHHQQKQQAFCVSRCTSSNAQSTKSKKRKNQMKRVCQMPAEGLSSDVWSWRKYGQKPIKGSPYPRGYYRCSTSKGCLARKQVERNRSDPNMFILTFTGEHNHPVPSHRNSLAGSTRTKPTSSPPVSPPTTKSPSTEKAEDNYDTEDDDNFFEGLDELVSPITRNNFPWLSTTVTSGGI